MANKAGRDILKKAAERLDIPVDVMAGVSRVEIIGMRQVYVENHRGILEYSGEEIQLNTDSHVLRIHGSGLEVSSMNASQIKLSGEIESVQFVKIQCGDL